MAAIKLSTLRQHPILLPFLAVWAFEAGMNALYGYNWGSARSVASGLLYGGIFLAIAFIGAWLGVKFLAIRGWDAPAWGRRTFLGLPLLGCIALSQITGWSVFGITIADGAAARENKATERSSQLKELKRAEEDRALLGAQPSPDEIKAKIEKELQTFIKREQKTVGQLTSNCTQSDWAPTTCRKVAELNIALKAAERAAELEAKISAGGKTVGVASNVGDPDARTSTLRKLTGATTADIDFWLNIFVVALIGFFANLGATLAGFADRSIAHAVGAVEAGFSLPTGPHSSVMQEHHHHYAGYQSPPQLAMPPYPPPLYNYPPPQQPVNISLALGNDRGSVVPLRSRDALAQQPELDQSEPEIPMPRFLSQVPDPNYPFYAKVFHALEIKPETYLQLSKPCRALALTAAGAFRRYVRTIPTLDQEIAAIETTTQMALRDALNMLIADVKEPDDHVRMMEIQNELSANFQLILLLPGGPYEKGLLHAAERLEAMPHDSRSLQYIRQLRHAVVMNPRTTDVDWRQLYQVLQ